ncbi:MAG: hypothetical protein GY866_19655, partial [Proteobacteria bacterium]|nr:hypothetical protein [Pseudomonadota bacterium]
MKRIIVFTAVLFGLLIPITVLAEGTAQLGDNQDIIDTTIIEVDILTAGEVINISAGDDGGEKDTNFVRSGTRIDLSVVVTDPNGDPVTGSPFTIGEGDPGWIAVFDQIPTPADLTNPLQIENTIVGTYRIEFDNPATFNDSSRQVDWAEVIAPFDITVTPDTTTPVNPALPPGGYGRVHSSRWRMCAWRFDQQGATNAEFYVLVPTGTTSDYTWLLKFDGMAGFVYDVKGNDIGLPAPNSGFSEDESNSGSPEPQYDIYLNVPENAVGGSITPTIDSFTFDGPTSLCDCSINPLESSFSFTSDVNGVYEIVIDIADKGTFDPAAGDVLLKGVTAIGENTVIWDGTDNHGVLVPSGTYDAKLSVRLGEFHFVGRDIETSNPGLRIFGYDPPEPSTSPSSAMMFWNDSRINTYLSLSHGDDPGGIIPFDQKVIPESTTSTGGISSGNYNGSTLCSLNTGVTEAQVNAHCWGAFDASEPDSPGNWRFIDTSVFFTESVLTTVACVLDPDGDDDGDGLTNGEECAATTDPQNADTDGDGISDGNELGGDNNTDPNNADSDDDGIPDGVEDTDQDGNLDDGETDPNIPDTDDDGLDDGVEDANKNGSQDDGETDPLDDDSDDDGITDGIEDADKDGTQDQGETDPLDNDSDDDEILDGTEDANHNGIFEHGETDPLDDDTDNDGLLDGAEDANHNGQVDGGGGVDGGVDGGVGGGETDPTKADTDGDGLDDGVEDANKNGKVDAGETDPTRADTDNDGLPDGIEDTNKNGKVDEGETDPLDNDSDDDGLMDGAEDTNADGIKDSAETDPLDPDTDDDNLPDGIEQGLNPDGSAIPNANPTDPNDADSDDDGLADGIEDANQDGVYQEGTETNPNESDTDGDGLSDGEEDASHDGIVDGNETDPRKWDTDGGSESDGSEVNITGHDPRDPSDDRSPNEGLYGGGC